MVLLLAGNEANAEIVDENANFPPPEPAPALFLKRTGATQTDSEEDQQNRHISTQTEPLPPVEKPLKVDKDNSPMSGGDSRRHSLHSIPRTTAVHDFSTLFRDDSFLNVPKNIMGEKRRLSNNRFNSQTHVHFCDENENWQKLSDELDGHLRNMIRHSRRRSSSTIRKAGEDRDQFFKQLRERYFNSPDYHRDERMAEYRTVVIVNNT
ncbi:unnamed protein product, partial [Mesorhabditis belari]|uniref:Uncharacterized protein n=1 Tax=Mesorhabditis belari TaxID=2138241 RepID=A0AAF3EWY1_9BILA